MANSGVKIVLIGLGSVVVVVVAAVFLMGPDKTADDGVASQDLARLAAIEAAEGFATGLKASDVVAANEYATEEFGAGTKVLLEFYTTVQFDTADIADYDVESDPLGLVAEGLVAELDVAVMGGTAYAFVGPALLGEEQEAQYALAIVEEDSEWKVASGTIRQSAPSLETPAPGATDVEETKVIDQSGSDADSNE